MCQLLGMNCATPTDFNFSFRGFKCRGGNTDIHAHGWGLAIYEGRGVRTFHDPLPCAESPIADMVSRYPIKTYNMMAHIRYATQGAVSLENVHPFEREMWGIRWTFAHNGEVPKFTVNPQQDESGGANLNLNLNLNLTVPLLMGTGRMAGSSGNEKDGSDAATANANTTTTSTAPCCQQTTFYHPVGDTDSEAVFCAMLNALRSEFTTLPTLPVLYEAIQRLCCEIVRGHESETIFNFLLGCGQFTMFAFSWPGSRKGSQVWNGLHYLVRYPPFSTAKLKDVDYKVDFNETNGENDRVAIIATKPLTTNENWKEFKRGQLLMFDRGLPYSRPYECAEAERCGRGLNSRAIPRGEICPFKYQYNIPKLLRMAVCEALGRADDDQTVWSERAMDLGCGSGLSGLQFRSCVRHLTGVDLLPELICEARERGCYDRLVVGYAECVLREAGDAVSNEQSSSASPEAKVEGRIVESPSLRNGYDFVFACDLFPYLEDLCPIFETVHRSLVGQGGTFAFSAEILNDTSGEVAEEEDVGFVMQSCARFVQKKWYIHSLVEKFGFEIMMVKESTVLRQHDGNDVIGALFVLALPSS
mmetsp:Transcript_2353/g.5079  ORF Transcript_2353/g.5079 Transcript_2353/m.5079 type:complete len:587 (-) Transcript_2353:241-2001(-)|eukprot:CAMPEP_0171349398 /NCGR_PEP_ID=MMETSP0878-20121228/33581_1 /TAXON_ID=67004 /ORGANISM="Thalassiosira weissflogii, Strain CCMP1336" /LENGTH=586 /DNA_ID=CAMNT_0011854047 /DNA_START=238 /DNA_END=1998 /DNA_ORIENTATION=-